MADWCETHEASIAASRQRIEPQRVWVAPADPLRFVRSVGLAGWQPAFA